MLEGAGALALELKPFYAPSHVPYVLRETDSDRSSCVCGVRRAPRGSLVRLVCVASAAVFSPLRLTFSLKRLDKTKGR